PQDGKAQHHAPHGGEKAGKRQGSPKADELKVGREQREGICAHCVEGYVAKVEEPCQTYDDVEPPAKHDIGHDEDGDIDELPIACREEVHRGKRQDQREDKEYAQHPFAEVRNRLCEAAEPCTHRRCCWTLDIEHEEIQRQ